jgi:hypothetical protein
VACWPSTNNWLATEELKYSRERARQHQRPTNNMFEGPPLVADQLAAPSRHCWPKLFIGNTDNCWLLFFCSRRCYIAAESMILSSWEYDTLSVRVSYSQLSSYALQKLKRSGFHPFGGKPPKARQPSLWPVDQWPTTTEELKNRRNRARWRQHPINNMFEVWQNLAPFGSRPIGGAVEALLTKIINWQY